MLNPLTSVKSYFNKFEILHSKCKKKTHRASVGGHHIGTVYEAAAAAAAVWALVAAVTQIIHRKAVTSSSAAAVYLESLWRSFCSVQQSVLRLLMLCPAGFTGQVQRSRSEVRHSAGLSTPLGLCSTGAVISCLILTSWVLIDIQTHRHKADMPIHWWKRVGCVCMSLVVWCVFVTFVIVCFVY